MLIYFIYILLKLIKFDLCWYILFIFFVNIKVRTLLKRNALRDFKCD